MKRFALVALLLLRSQVALAATAEDSRNVVVSIRGMSCSSCAVGIQSMLKRSAGVSKVGVSYPRREAVVTYDAHRTSPGKIVETIERLGYHATIRK